VAAACKFAVIGAREAITVLTALILACNWVHHTTPKTSISSHFDQRIIEEREAFYVQDEYMSCVPANVEFLKVTDALAEYTTTGVGSRAGEMVGVLSATRLS
jgi:hypothetical protein